MKTGEVFSKALRDYHYLLENGYDTIAARDFVGNRYQLSGEQRSILFRGVFSGAESKIRRRRLKKPDALDANDLHIDAVNVIYTLLSYLAGRKVFIATDGLMRDAAEFHKKMPAEDHLEQAIQLLFHTLLGVNLASLNFYLEEKMPASTLIRKMIGERSPDKITPIEYELFPDPEKLLASMQTGLLSTSNTSLIFRSSLPVFDLARHVIEKNFSPNILDLSYLNA